MFLKLRLWIILVVLGWTGDRAGPLGEKWRQLVGKVGEWCVENRHLHGCTPLPSPPVSIKDRWVAPHEQVLNVLIVCRWYGPGKPSSLLSTNVWLSPLLHWLARERNWVRTHGSVSWRVVDFIRSSFLGSSDYVQLCQWLMGDCHVRGPPVGSVRQAYEAYVSCWSGFSM
jgi:hypothetical protein